MSGLYSSGRPDPRAGDWNPLKMRSGYKCRHKFEFEVDGEVFTRDCKRCEDCIAMAKRDLSGRAGAEAYLSAEVQVWTLTYRPGEPGADRFITRDRQLFLKRVRFALYSATCRRLGVPYRFKGCSPQQRADWQARIKDALPVVRYLGCGERGEANGRCHWHIVLFLSKPTETISSPRGKDGKLISSLHPWWEFGLCTRDVIPAERELEAKMKAIRYIVKYVSKARQGKRGAAREAVFFRSTATPLGAAYLIGEAKRAAAAGIPLPSFYCVPGLMPSYRPGARFRLTKHQVRGVVKDHYMRAYQAEWQRLRPDVPMPETDWWKANDPDNRKAPSVGGDFDRMLAEGQKLRARQIAKWHEERESAASRVLVVNDTFGNLAALVEVLPEGLRLDLCPPGKSRAVCIVPDTDLWDVAGADPAELERVARAVRECRDRDARDLARRQEQARAVLRFAKRGPNERPEWIPGIDPLTGLLRQLSLRGPVPPGARLRKPVAARSP